MSLLQAIPSDEQMKRQTIRFPVSKVGFKHWLTRTFRPMGAIGELSRMVQSDRKFPVFSTDRSEVESYLTKKGISRDIIEEAWTRYKRATWSKVYFIQAGTDGPIKIGYTTGRIKERLTSMQSCNHEQLHVLAEMNGDRNTELDLHDQFDTHRRRGEWFDPHPTLLEYIETVKILPAEVY